MKMRRMKKEKLGVALVIVLVMTMLIAALLAVLVRSAATHARIAGAQADMEKAFYVAQAGAEHAVSYLANGGGGEEGLTGNLGEGSYSVTISKTVVVISGSSNTEANVVLGLININPNNNSDNEFTLATPAGTITRDDLAASYGGYTGNATNIHVRPKGNGNQNGLTVDGAAVRLHNGTTYDISTTSNAFSFMTVNLYNDNVVGGMAMGKWWIQITGSSDININPPISAGVPGDDDEDDEDDSSSDGITTRFGYTISSIGTVRKESRRYSLEGVGIIDGEVVPFDEDEDDEEE